MWLKMAVTTTPEHRPGLGQITIYMCNMMTSRRNWCGCGVSLACHCKTSFLTQEKACSMVISVLDSSHALALKIAFIQKKSYQGSAKLGHHDANKMHDHVFFFLSIKSILPVRVAC